MVQESGKKQQLRICVLLPDFYDADMPATTTVREIYGNYLPQYGHEVTWIMAGKVKKQESKEISSKNMRILLIPYELRSFFLTKK